MSRVLVVEDDAGIRSLMTMLLSGAGFDVETASNGREGLERVSAERDRPFAAIVLDLQMPVMDGRTFYRRLRQSNLTTPVLVLSANGAETACRELEADDALAKPFDTDTLLERVGRLIGRASGQGSSSVSTGGQPGGPARLHPGASRNEPASREGQDQRQ